MKQTGYNLDVISDEEVNSIVCRLLLMVRKKENLFMCISGDIISELIFQDYIDIDIDNETMEGTTLTKKGLKFLYENELI